MIDAPPIAGPATESPLFASALSVDQNGNLYIVDAPNSSVSPDYLVKVTPGGGLSVLAGNGQSGEPVAGSALASPLGAGSISPDQVTVDGHGNVYMAQPNPSSNAEPNLSGYIVRVTPAGQLSVLASNATAQKATGMGDHGTPSQLNPSGLAMNPAGLMYVADTAGYLYRVGCG